MTRNIRLPTRPSSRRASLIGSSALAGGLALALASSAYALPTGGEVVAGGAGIAGTAGGMTVTQSTQNAVINWQTFGIGQGEAVTFVQPNATAVALNRVLGADPSEILGRLSANGRVFIVNPNGVLFGAGAQVSVAGLVASTLNISDADLMGGRYSFSGPGGSVTNLGAINADGGFVALLGGAVTNQGVVSARLGTVALAAGEAVTLDFKGDGLLNVSVDRGAVGALVRNGGMIRADGGQVMLTARAAGGLLKTVVNNTGAIEARTLDTRGGVIRLVGEGGAVVVGGTLSATGFGEGQQGGAIVVTGQAVELNGATLDASGHSGGGTVRVGGGYQGRDADVANAQSVSFGADSTIAADAIRSGNGGRAIVWSDGETTALGTINARGGALSGDGGFVETSGQHVVTHGALRVNTLAPNGKTGLWLLDPVNYVIAGAGGDETGAQVGLSLAASNRLIQADNNITVSDVISWATSFSLTLNAGNDITISSAVNMSGVGAQLILIAGHDLTTSGAISNSNANARLTYTAGNDVTISGAAVATGAGALIDVRAGHNITQSAAITSSGGGAIQLRADNDGTGGIGGGTVILSTPAAVTADNVAIYYSPQNGYASPNDYSGVIGTSTETAQMWAFATAANKVYDGTTAATLTFVGDPTAGGVNSVGLGGGANFVDKNVGAAKTVNFSGATLTGSDAARFALYGGSGSATAAITPATLVITANSQAKPFGQVITFPGGAFTSAGLVAGETIGSVTETSPGAAASANVAGSPYVITASNATGGTFSLANYTTSYVAGALTVTPAGLVVTADSFSKDYGQTLTFNGQQFTSTGLLNGDTIGGVTLTSAGAAPTASVVGGPYAVDASNATGGTFTAANYAISYATGTVTVVPVALLVTASDASKIYGDTATFAPTAFSVSGLRNGETAATVLESSAGAAAAATVAGGPYAIAASNLAGGTFTASNYVISYAPGVLTITPAALLVTANNASKVFGNTATFLPSAFTTSGLKNGDTATTAVESSAGSAATASVAGGPYAIGVSNLGGGSYVASNYVTTYAPGTLVITPAPLVVTANNATKTYGDTTTFAPGAFTITGLKNGDTATTAVESSAGQVATAPVAGNPYAIAVSSLAGGTYTASNYATTYVPGALVITPATLVIDANDGSKPYLKTLIFTGHEFTSTGLRNGETVGAVSLTSPGAAAAALPTTTPYAITASGGTGGTYTPANYAITYTTGDLIVTAPGGISTAGGEAINSVPTGFTPDGRSEGTTVPSATEMAEAQRERDRQALEQGGSGLAQSVAGPAGTNLAVTGDGVRMPAYQLAQVQPAESAQAAAPTVVQQRAPQAPAEAAPVRARKQDRN